MSKQNYTKEEIDEMVAKILSPEQLVSIEQSVNDFCPSMWSCELEDGSHVIFCIQFQCECNKEECEVWDIMKRKDNQ